VLSALPNPFAIVGHLGSIADSAAAMSRDTAMLSDLHDSLVGIENHLRSVDAEVALMRRRVDIMGSDVVALQRLEAQLADVGETIAPLRRLGGRAARRRAAEADTVSADAPDAAVS
jgi:hypothetical protein